MLPWRCIEAVSAITQRRILCTWTWGASGWWRGAAIGFVHGAFVLTALMPLFPHVHPRMAIEQQSPAVTRPLEPPERPADHGPHSSRKR